MLNDPIFDALCEQCEDLQEKITEKEKQIKAVEGKVKEKN